MKKSAGILLYRKRQQDLEILLVHPGGPFWKHKDIGAWSIPKGELNESEEPLICALREFKEETGFDLDGKGEFITLNPVRLKSGKVVSAFAVEGDIDPEHIKSNTIIVSWPPKSGKMIEVPEVDKAGWFTLEEGKKKINEAQQEFLEELNSILKF